MLQLQQVSDAFHHCSLPGMSMAQVLGQAPCSCGLELPKLLLVAGRRSALAACSLSRGSCLLHRANLPAAMRCWNQSSSRKLPYTSTSHGEIAPSDSVCNQRLPPCLADVVVLQGWL